jgi:RNA-splicing ligase RtcB
VIDKLAGRRRPCSTKSPSAYNDIGAVMDAQSDLVAIKHRLRQVVNVKG